MPKLNALKATQFMPSAAQRIARARGDLSMGLAVGIVADEPWLAAAAETLTEAGFAALKEVGPVVLAMTARRAETLKLAAYDGDLVRIEADIDFATLRALADPSLDPDYPLKMPLHALRTGSPLAARAAIALAKSAQLLPAMVLVQAPPLAEMSVIGAEAAINESHRPVPHAHVAAANFPISASEFTRLHVYRPDEGGPEHYAIQIGHPDPAQPVLTRLHSACFTGDVLGSLKCDCGPQLHAAIDAMATGPGGVLLYLNQEGRGIGLANKMRAYTLQQHGLDTVEANHRLGFFDDERDFRIGAGLLSDLGIRHVRLLTNNPLKIEKLSAQGIEVVERIPLVIDRNRHNAGYLATKMARSGHFL